MQFLLLTIYTHHPRDLISLSLYFLSTCNAPLFLHIALIFSWTTVSASGTPRLQIFLTSVISNFIKFSFKRPFLFQKCDSRTIKRCHASRDSLFIKNRV